MPVSSFVDPSNRLVITLCAGQIAVTEIAETFAEIRKHPGFHPDFCQLSDLSRVSSIPLHFPDLYHLQQACDPFSNKGRRAVIAPEAVPFGLSRMYQLIVNSPNFEVFRALPDALVWLEWSGTVLEDVVRGLVQEKNLVVPADPDVKPLGETGSSELVDFLKRLRKASSA